MMQKNTGQSQQFSAGIWQSAKSPWIKPKALLQSAKIGLYTIYSQISSSLKAIINVIWKLQIIASLSFHFTSVINSKCSPQLSEDKGVTGEVKENSTEDKGLINHKAHLPSESGTTGTAAAFVDPHVLNLEKMIYQFYLYLLL